MHGSYRRIILAAVGWLILAGANHAASYPPKDDQKAAASRRNAGTKQAAGTIASAVSITNQPIARDKGCDPGNDKRDSDLCAQWKAADSASDAATYAFWTVVLSAVGTGLLVWTLWETRKTTRRELRAYVDVFESGVIDGSKLPAESPNFGKVGAGIIIKNSGQTPAYNLVHWAEIRVAKFTDQHTLTPPTKLTNLHATTVPAGGVISKPLLLRRKLTRWEQIGVRKETHGIFAFGRIEYTDIFRRRHVTEYRLHYCGAWPLVTEAANLNFCESGNRSD